MAHHSRLKLLTLLWAMIFDIQSTVGLNVTEISVAQGVTVYLWCNTSSSQVYWTHDNERGYVTQFYKDGRIQGTSDRILRFVVDTTVRGQFSLHIRPVEERDRGVYTCCLYSNHVLYSYRLTVTEAASTTIHQCTDIAAEGSTNIQSNTAAVIALATCFGIAVVVIVAILVLLFRTRMKLKQVKGDREERDERQAFLPPPIGNNNSSPASLLDGGRVRQWKLEDESVFVRGLALLDDIIYVSRPRKENQIEMYSAKDLAPTGSISLSGLSTNLHSLVAYSKSRHLFLCDIAQRSIVRISLSNQNVDKKWPVDEIPWCLSINEKIGYILVTFRQTSKLIEYDSEGKQFRLIQLADPIVSPRHAIQLSKDQFIVSQGFIGESLHRVTSIDSSQNVSNYCGTHPSRAVGYCNEPCYMAVDREGNIIVVDRGNARVILLTKELQWKEIVAEGLTDAHTITYDRQHHCIYVTQCYGSRISIVQMPESKKEPTTAQHNI